MAEIIIEAGPGTTIEIGYGQGATQYGDNAAMYTGGSYNNNQQGYSNHFDNFLQDFRPGFSQSITHFQQLINELLECRNRPEPVYAVQSTVGEARSYLNSAYQITLDHLNRYGSSIESCNSELADLQEEIRLKESQLQERLLAEQSLNQQLQSIRDNIGYNANLLGQASLELERTDEHLRHEREARVGWAIGTVLFPPLGVGLLVNEGHIHHTEEKRVELEQMMTDHRQSLAQAEAQLQQTYQYKAVLQASIDSSRIRSGLTMRTLELQRSERYTIEILSQKLGQISSTLTQLQDRLSTLNPNSWCSFAVEGLLVSFQDLHDFILETGVTSGSDGPDSIQLIGNRQVLVTPEAMDSLRWCCHHGRNQLNQYVAMPD